MKLPTNTALGRTLRMVEVLDFYDFPRLFICSNAAGQHYVAIWYDDVDGGTVWLYAAVNQFKLSPLVAGQCDIRDLFLHADDGQVLRVTTRVDGAMVETVPCETLDPTTLTPVMPPAHTVLRAAYPDPAPTFSPLLRDPYEAPDDDRDGHDEEEEHQGAREGCAGAPQEQVDADRRGGSAGRAAQGAQARELGAQGRRGVDGAERHREPAARDQAARTHRGVRGGEGRGEDHAWTSSSVVDHCHFYCDDIVDS